TSFPAKAELSASPADAKDLKSRACRLTLESDVVVGIGGIVVASPSGASDVLLLLIDDLGSVADNGNNRSVAEAQPIDIPTAVDGVVDGSPFDYYKFSGKKDQRISVEVVAARLGTSLDAVVRLLRTDGSELKLADDDVSLGADCRFSVTLPEDGEYLLEVRDNQYRSGGRYRLRIGDFPLVTVPYPLAGRRGSTRRFDFAGPSQDDVASLMFRVPDRIRGDRLSIAARFPDGNASALATLITSDLPEVVESEPNNAAEMATPVTLPVGLNGRLDPAGDRDYFEFAALKDQSLAFMVISRSLGSPSVASMRLYDAANKQLAETPISDSDEWTFTYRFPADGMYRLMVEDLVRRGGPEHAYRVEVRPSIGFSLTIKQDESTRFNPPVNGGAIALTIQCDRQGYDGPIELA
ncbi:MAG: PPC domain-containing protein, partial [Pirellulaceae bacterium]